MRAFPSYTPRLVLFCVALSFAALRCGKGLLPLDGHGVITGGGATSFATQLTGVTTLQSLVLTNASSRMATGISGSAFSRSGAFGYSGGSFPGTAGNCGETLAPGASCTVEVRFTSLSAGSFSGSFEINYDGASAPLVFSLSGSVIAGGLDPTFGPNGDGIASGNGAFFGAAFSILRQPDGKIVTGGQYAVITVDFGLYRFLSDGSLDSTFGVNGVTTHAIGISHDYLYSLALQSDGKIVAAGYYTHLATPYMVVTRYLTDGSLDSTFSTDGIASTGVSSYGQAVAIQSDGKIVVGGAQANEFAAFRFLTDGSLDPTFDGDGVGLVAVSGGADRAMDMVILPDGKVLLAGASNIGGTAQSALAVLLTDGTPDLGFGAGGFVTHDIGTGNEELSSVTLTSDGQFLTAGTAIQSGLNDSLLARFLTDGSLDSSFAGTGYVLTSISTGTDVFLETAPLVGEKIGVVGYGVFGGAVGAVAGRLLSDGSFDSGFGVNGISTPGGGTGQLLSISFLSDGGFLAGGVHTLQMSVYKFLP